MKRHYGPGKEDTKLVLGEISQSNTINRLMVPANSMYTATKCALELLS